jgi:hypothetical protein
MAASQVVGAKKGGDFETMCWTKKINGVEFEMSSASSDVATIVVHYRSVLDGKVRRLDMKTNPEKTSYIHCKKFVLSLAQHRSVWDTTARGPWDAPPVRPSTTYNYKDHLPVVNTR